MDATFRLLLQSPALRAIEQAHATLPLMERAGAAAARLGAQLQQGQPGMPLILVGPGNNGGDGLVMARLLKEQGIAPIVVSRADPARLPADAKAAWDKWQAAGGSIAADIPEHPIGLMVDALFGIGLTRPASGVYAEWIDRINRHGGPVLALDCPSGLNADTGQAFAPTVKASHTLTFIAAKPGLLTLDGPDHCGIVCVDDLALGDAVAAADSGRVLGVEDFRACLHPRANSSHKGSYGNAVIIGGAAGMAGAALLAGRAALHLGAGRVYLGMLEQLAVDLRQPELMLRPAAETLPLATALAVGPGLGHSAETLDLLRQAIDSPAPLVIDADGLNLLAAHPALHRHVAQRTSATVLTPHPLEAARLLESSVAAVQADRIMAARELAARFGALVVLKGAGSVVADPFRRWAVNTSGNPGLATAGTGDVLTGFVLALLAQGWPAEAALAAAVHLHGRAAERCVAAGCGPVGLTAGELLAPARAQLNEWIARG